MPPKHLNTTLPPATPIVTVLAECAPLARLAQRLHESNARFAAIGDALQPPLRKHVRPGPLDEAGWSLLAANTSVAAKLRQLVPRIEEALQAQGWAALPVRIKVQQA